MTTLLTRRFLVLSLALLGLQTKLGSAETPSLDEIVAEQYPPSDKPSSSPHYTCSDNKSWAIVSTSLSDPDKQKEYDRFMNVCREAAGDRAYDTCDAEEAQRMRMNQFQPRSMRNYTAKGFTKTRAPEEVISLIKEFWEENKDEASVEWQIPTTYHNNWEVPPTILRVDDRKLKGGGKQLQAMISNAARDFMEDWTGQRLASSSVYGIRIYHRGSILTPHTDRLPLVSSAIINVAQDCDEDNPWPLEVYDHDGVAHNVSMEPGDMVLYESHSVIHGRPFKSHCDFYANVFIHFEPIGPLDDKEVEVNHSGLPPYVLEGSAWEMVWRDQNPNGWWVLNEPRLLVQRGDLNTLQYVAKIKPDMLHQADKAGWTPIHEAARQGDLRIARYLVDNGADINSRARVRYGYQPLSVSLDYHGEDHPVTQLLRNLGAVPFDGKKNKTTAPVGGARSEL